MLVETLGLSNNNKIFPRGSMQRDAIVYIVIVFYFSLSFFVQPSLMEVNADSLGDGSETLPFSARRSRVSSPPAEHRRTVW
jgi:hypothetical protein